MTDAGPRTGISLYKKRSLLVLLQQCLQRRQHLLAVWTTVVEELDDCHIAPRIASYRRCRVVENLAPLVAQNFCRFGIGLTVQLIFGPVQRLDQNVGIVDQIVVDDPLDRFALLELEFRQLALVRNAAVAIKPQTRAKATIGKRYGITTKTPARKG